MFRQGKRDSLKFSYMTLLVIMRSRKSMMKRHGQCAAAAEIVRQCQPFVYQ